MSRFTDLIDSIESTLADPTVEFVVGNDKQKKRGQRRRIHFYRRGGPITTANRSGGGDIGSSRVATPWQREGVVEAHIFSESDDTTEQLTDNLISAIFNTTNTGLEFFDYEWDDDQINQRTCYCILRFSIRTPVRSEDLTLITVTGQETDKEFL